MTTISSPDGTCWRRSGTPSRSRVDRSAQCASSMTRTTGSSSASRSSSSSTARTAGPGPRRAGLGVGLAELRQQPGQPAPVCRRAAARRRRRRRSPGPVRRSTAAERRERQALGADLEAAADERSASPALRVQELPDQPALADARLAADEKGGRRLAQSPVKEAQLFGPTGHNGADPLLIPHAPRMPSSRDKTDCLFVRRTSVRITAAQGGRTWCPECAGLGDQP